MMKPCSLLILAMISIATLSCSPAQEEQKKPKPIAVKPIVQKPKVHSVWVGTGNVTGTYYPAGGAFCRLINQSRKQHGIRCAVESTDGSIYNTHAVASKRLDIGIAQADIAYKALHGQAPFRKNIPQLRSLFAIHPKSLSLLVRLDAIIMNMERIRKKRIGLGNPGSDSANTSKTLLEACDIPISDLSLTRRFTMAKTPNALLNKKLDGYFDLIGHPIPHIKEMASLTPIELVAITGDCVDKLIATHPYYVKTEIPGGIYQGVNRPTPSFGIKAIVITSTDLADEAAYQIVKALFDNLDNFIIQHPVLNHLNQKSMLEGLSVPIHPGALKYYKERGWKQDIPD
jgi:uncharacterized protein